MRKIIVRINEQAFKNEFGSSEKRATLYKRFYLFWFIPLWEKEDEVRGYGHYSDYFIEQQINKWQHTYNLIKRKTFIEYE